MYCPNCNCEYIGRAEFCPHCREPLLDEPPPALKTPTGELSYEQLVQKVVKNEGRLEIQLSAVQVHFERKWSFPYFGYGYAWTERMTGELDGMPVELITTQVGRDRTQRFLFRGYGFAWMKEAQGKVAGNDLELKISKLMREMRWSFPYFGYGYAHAERMRGTCGAELLAELVITEAGRRSEEGFPYRGFGFAWEHKGTLALIKEEAGKQEKAE